MRLTTAITAATPMTTPMSVRTLRSLCAQRLEVAIATASEKFIVDGLAMGERRDRIGPHPNIRRGGGRNNMAAEAGPYSCVQQKKRASKWRPPEIEAVFLEHQAHAYPGAERLLEEIVVHSGRCVGLFEVVG